MTLRQDIENAIIECNAVIAKWAGNEAYKRKLANYTDIKALIMHYLHRCIRKHMGYRRMRDSGLSAKQVYVDFCTNRSYITGIELLDATPKFTDLLLILKDIDYQSLSRQAPQVPVSSLSQIDFKSIQDIKFT